ncbi:precorrin-6y C5,15-methyltransferase (decarboxylating) subunit CbiE [Rhodovulum tesquicola]|uniref:precorrin-6y C5,15-methyltransferase (decarboxylating) subunit CbiE n=1 Tax=Rhodovulum tesquicola TaxID=540254 RepID=UPI00209845FF|nr:precorrin-6y C5,15-methyltransferase (decarboxylating) subunit CbiE [Rhodovulum tesquicola]MCO8145179.1 precorrin-6y C5,15-methyltransferase (decarboxylating) subunit CbiE [Rhodovulum tesquicola]
MAEAPWLTIVGLGEDGPDGLPPASRAALEAAEIVMGPTRHLGLLPDLAAERVEWPVPFADGLEKLRALRGRPVVVLASGDPFWFGAGSVIARDFAPGEWRAFPAPSVFSLAAAHLGWRLERTPCLGLHATPFGQLRPHLAPGARALVLLRDGSAVRDLVAWLTGLDFGETGIWVMEALGGPRERVRNAKAAEYDLTDVAHPVCVGLKVAGTGAPIPACGGWPDDLFDHDGQITKRPVRALTLSALAPRPGEHLWDIGAGSGSISIEWLACHPSMHATAVEADPARADRIRTNAAALGVDRLRVVEGRAPEVLDGLDPPQAVFIGGGLSEVLLSDLWARLGSGTRVVANAVTLESEALLAAWQAAQGGSLLRVELAEAQPLGTRRGWRTAYPVVQWSAVR